MILSPWNDLWLHCERCEEWLDAEHAVIVELMVPRLSFADGTVHLVPQDAAVHIDRDYCKDSLSLTAGEVTP